MVTEFLLRRVSRKGERPDDPQVRQRCGMAAGGIGCLCNALLFGVKMAAGLLSGSIAVMADAVNNLSDAGSSVVALIGFKLSAKPADDEHPFGHGRMEYVAGLVVAVIIVAIGLNFLKSSAERIWNPEPVEVTPWVVAALIAAIPVKLWMFFFYRSVGRKIRSTVLSATAFDSLSDIMTTLVVLLSVLLSLFTSFPADGYAGLLVAALIIWGGVKVVRQTIDPLLGVCPDRELVEELERKMLENPDICGVHDLILHNYGPGRYFATAHAEVNSDCDPVRIHDSLENTERRVARELPIQLTLHCDPFDRNDAEYKEWRLATVRTAEEIDARFRVYDFRMFRSKRGLRLQFNLLVPRECSKSSRELRGELERRLRSRDPGVVVSIRIENTFV